MKKLNYIAFIIVLFSGCDLDNTPECLKGSGKIKETVLNVSSFSTIRIMSEFNVIIKEGPQQIVRLEVGENLLDKVKYEVIDNEFTIINNNSCHWTRPYNFPVLRIIHPNISTITQSAGGLVKSEGILNFPKITLVNDDQSGDFEMEFNSESISVSNNEVCNFYLSGQTDNLIINFHSGDGRFEGTNLQAKKVDVGHRGSNDVIVNAIESLTGSIQSTGNLIYVKSAPPVIDVSIENRGKLINKTN